jgi:hypothetical protein
MAMLIFTLSEGIIRNLVVSPSVKAQPLEMISGKQVVNVAPIHNQIAHGNISGEESLVV